MKEYKILSLFSGCGGLDLGFQGAFSFLGKSYEKLPFEVVWANDIDKHACTSYKNNINNHIICSDIWNIIKKESNLIYNKKIDIVVGGFPCQDFSHAGKRKGLNSERGTLYEAMCDIIKKKQPKLFLAENVKGLLTIDNGSVIEKIVNDFSTLGYNVQYELIFASDFGISQKRERVIIVGTKKEFFPKFDFSLLNAQKTEPVSLEVVLGDLEHKDEGTIENHFWSKAKKNNGQGNSPIKKNELAPTMRAEHHGNIEFHWNKQRRLSAREAARIQSFPDDFIFYPSTSSAYRQLGNAVPPVLAWNLGKAVASFMQDSKLNS